MDLQEIDLSKIDIKWYSKNFRGLYSACDVKKGELILDISLKNVLLYNRCVGTEIGKKMMSKDGNKTLYG